MREQGRYWNIAYLLLFVAIVIGVSTRFASTASANHRVAGGWHQTKMHSADANSKEAVCVQVGADSHVSHASFRLNVRAKLYVDNTAEDWDELAGSKIYLDMPLVNGAAQPCTGFPNRSAIPIELYLSHNTLVKDANWYFANACGANVGCTKNDVDVWNPIVNHYDKRDGYQWYPEARMYVNTYAGGDHAYQNDSQRSYLVSHEFGHIFGMDDPPGGGQAGDTLCDKSIMHAGKWRYASDGVTKIGCYNPISIFWPQQIDRDVVTGIANNG